MRMKDVKFKIVSNIQDDELMSIFDDNTFISSLYCAGKSVSTDALEHLQKPLKDDKDRVSFNGRPNAVVAIPLLS